MLEKSAFKSFLTCTPPPQFPKKASYLKQNWIVRGTTWQSSKLQKLCLALCKAMGRSCSNKSVALVQGDKIHVLQALRKKGALRLVCRVLWGKSVPTPNQDTVLLQPIRSGGLPAYNWRPGQSCCAGERETGLSHWAGCWIGILVFGEA